jgi:hypothetical protein
MVIDLAVNGDLDARQGGTLVGLLATREAICALFAISEGALAVDVARIDPVAVGLGAHLVEGVRVAGAGGIDATAGDTAVGVDADDVGGALLVVVGAADSGGDGRGAVGTTAGAGAAGACSSGRGIVGGAAGGRVDGGASVGAALSEGAADGEDDTEGHGGGKDGGHGGDSGLDGVGVAGGADDEPEEHVDHVDEPDGAVEVEAVAEHELPRGERLDLERLDRAVEGETEGEGVEKRGCEPVDADPVRLRTRDAALAVEQGHDPVKRAAGGHHRDLQFRQSKYPLGCQGRRRGPQTRMREAGQRVVLGLCAADRPLPR